MENEKLINLLTFWIDDYNDTKNEDEKNINIEAIKKIAEKLQYNTI
jgi:hypothetical protein